MDTSFNSWSDVVTYDEAFIQEWLRSPQTILYYSLQVMQDTQAKDDALAALEGTDFNQMFGFQADDVNELGQISDAFDVTTTQADATFVPSKPNFN